MESLLPGYRRFCHHHRRTESGWCHCKINERMFEGKTANRRVVCSLLWIMFLWWEKLVRFPCAFDTGKKLVKYVSTIVQNRGLVDYIFKRESAKTAFRVFLSRVYLLWNMYGKCLIFFSPNVPSWVVGFTDLNYELQKFDEHTLRGSFVFFWSVSV